ncbi:MAG TPA: SusC/RagA family TonB-linked outer membrane protein, partial [Segetibacter sp.]|nr:SusC/RagA family TonB-linked outer membrane protein [Segetibacter sp.]
MRKILSLFSVFMLVAILVFAQTRTISGRVVDEAGQPVSGASITIKGSGVGASANAEGTFTINAKTGDVLVISAVGAANKEVKVTTGSALTVSLTRQSQSLSEVVVTTALGVQRQKKELGYSTATVRNAELTQAKTINLQNGLTGKVSGLNVTTVGSGVLGETKINLRGLRSLTGNNQPMLVVDGVPTPISYINTINPSDIQEVNILKGPSAAAVYGPDAVNGAIMVTTRKGTRGKPVITVSHTTQIETVSYMPKMQTQFGSGSHADVYGNPEYIPYENQQYGPAFNGELVEIGKPLANGDIQKVPYSPLKDEKRKFWNTGLTSQNDVSFSTQDFYVSAQDVKVQGVMPKDENRRTTFRFNAAKEFNRFRASFNLSYIQGNYNIVNDAAFAGRYANTYSGSVYFTVLNTAMHIPLTSYKDWRNNPFASYGGYYNEFARNPYWVIDNHRTRARNDDFLGSLELSYKFANWLNATYRLGTNFELGQFKNETAPIISDDYAIATRGTAFANAPGSVADGMGTNSRINQEFFVSGKTSVSDLGFTYLAGTLLRENNQKGINVSGSNLVVPFLYNLSNRSGEPGASESNFRSRLASVYGSFGITYKGWAFIEFSGRNDWDSRLRLNTNDPISYFYPGVNASLVLSDAIPALKGNKTISYAKLRGAWSKSGNVNLGTYALEATASQSGGFPYGNLGGFSIGNTKPDVGIQPEFVKSTEIGLELGFLRNRINLEATVFQQHNDNQILTVQQSWATGYP